MKHGIEHSKSRNEKLASDLAALTGETKTQAVTKALRKRLADRLDGIAKHWASLPILDGSTPEDTLYDEHGLPR
jgi:antitoxin VapB